VKNEYPHFNPVPHKLDVKVAVVRTSKHSKHNINYHIIWIPKYRKKVLTGKIKELKYSELEQVNHGSTIRSQIIEFAKFILKGEPCQK
jgi:hypothetical protein